MRSKTGLLLALAAAVLSLAANSQKKEIINILLSTHAITSFK